MSSSPSGSARRLALTIDDLPVAVPESAHVDRFRILDSLLDTLDTHSVRTIGFVIGAHVLPEDTQLLDRFVGAGHLVGNHSFAHTPLDRLPISEFESDLLMCEKRLERWLSRPKYYRYPLLRTGNDLEKKNSSRNLLEAHQYTPVWATMDYRDWAFDESYCRALKESDEKAARAIALEYMSDVMAASEFYWALGAGLWSAPIAHIAVLHANALNADYLGVIIESLTGSGWTFVHPLEAVRDPVYALPDRRLAPTGGSWLYQVCPL